MSHVAAAVESELQALNRLSARLADRGATSDVRLARSNYAILGLLRDDGPQRIGRIADAFQLDPSTLTRQVKAVVELGLACRRQDPDDRRAVILEITDLGRTTVEAARDARSATVESSIDGWTEQDRETFLRLLTKFNLDSAAWPRLARLSTPTDVLPHRGSGLA